MKGFSSGVKRTLLTMNSSRYPPNRGGGRQNRKAQKFHTAKDFTVRSIASSRSFFNAGGFAFPVSKIVSAPIFDRRHLRTLFDIHRGKIYSCATGIAHTYLVAELLAKTARTPGHSIKNRNAGNCRHRKRARRFGHWTAEAAILAVDGRIQKAERFLASKFLSCLCGRNQKRCFLKSHKCISTIPEPWRRRR